MLGEVLRKERERRNLTIQDIEQSTSIRSLYIECIENGDYDKLPGDVYTKGFIRSYADFLKLNADELTAQFNMERNPVVATGTIEENSGSEGNEITAGVSEIPSRRERNKNKKISSSSTSNLSNVDSSGSSFKIIAAVVLIAALAAGAWVYLSSAGSEVVDIDVKQEQEKTSVNQNLHSLKLQIQTWTQLQATKMKILFPPLLKLKRRE